MAGPEPVGCRAVAGTGIEFWGLDHEYFGVGTPESSAGSTGHDAHGGVRMGFTPEAIEAGPYLAVYAVLLCAVSAVRVGAYFWAQSRALARTAPSLGPYDVAAVSGYSYRVVETALAGLVDSVAVTVHPGDPTEFRPRPDAGQRVQDPVQRQVLELLPSHANLHSLTRAFTRTETAAGLRRRLVSAGFLLSYPGRELLTWVTWALLPLTVLTMAVWQWASKATGLPLFPEVFVSAAAAIWWGMSLPLTGTRRAKRLRAMIASVERKYRPTDRQKKKEKVPAETVVRKVREAVTARAGEWGLAPGWIDSATGMVPFLGWSGYSAERGEHLEPQRYWTPGTRRAGPKSGPRRDLGWRYRALGVACGVLALGVVFPGMLFLNVFSIPLFLVCSAVGARLAMRGKKHLAADGREVLRTSYAPPVLYLRSFAHDALLERHAPFRSLMAALGSGGSYLEELATAVRRFGTFVAIGNPGNPLPALGPAHIYVPPEPDPGPDLHRWQAEVLNLMHGASLVLISAGHSEGLRWEFAQATSLMPPERLVVLVPLNREEYARFRERTHMYFRAGLPADPRKRSVRNKEQIHGLIYFDRDWTPHFVAFRRHALLQLHLGRIVIRPSLRRVRNRLTHALYPVFRSNRVGWPGIVLPVPFGRASRHRVVPGLSVARALLLAVVLSIAAAVVSSFTG
ncbi:TIGR04222 domain-containing membrane protein [Saccharopolyspora sp. NPDC050642]|uniref:TIGR04222 domain-containing membrane protein n=1 Tax=Saccharopolyspora sp. NPDC050642 TaxID=3157099 RepID=UPI0033F9632A